MNTDVDVASSMAEDSSTTRHHGGYTNDSWATISPYSQSPYDGSPLNEYPNFSPFVTPGVPPSDTVDRIVSSSEASQRQSVAQPTHIPLLPQGTSIGHHQLPMLHTTWPSQITNPTPCSGSYSAPAVIAAPLPRPLGILLPPKLPSQAEKSRKTLSTEQKRAMCQYHEDNPGTRQADIGFRFGVERR